MIARLHYITQDISGKQHDELAYEACRAGVDWVQLRLKNQTEQMKWELARRTLKIVQKHHARLIIDDDVIMAKTLGADGVHLGKEDMFVDDARDILGDRFIIGGTANTFADIQSLARSKVDYIGLGPYKFTSTKKKISPVLGLKGYEETMRRMKAEGIAIPVVAIGGIELEDISGLMEAGVHGIAVASLVNKSQDKTAVVESAHHVLSGIIKI